MVGSIEWHSLSCVEERWMRSLLVVACWLAISGLDPAGEEDIGCIWFRGGGVIDRVYEGVWGTRARRVEPSRGGGRCCSLTWRGEARVTGLYSHIKQPDSLHHDCISSHDAPERNNG